jgi:hypothetical protein
MSYRGSRGNHRVRKPVIAILNKLARAFEWVLVALIAVMAALAVHLIVAAPNTRSDAENRLILEIAAENRTFCENRGLHAQSREYRDCVAELNEIRAKHERRITEPLGW